MARWLSYIPDGKNRFHQEIAVLQAGVFQVLYSVVAMPRTSVVAEGAGRRKNYVPVRVSYENYWALKRAKKKRRIFIFRDTWHHFFFF